VTDVSDTEEPSVHVWSIPTLEIGFHCRFESYDLLKEKGQRAIWSTYNRERFLMQEMGEGHDVFIVRRTGHNLDLSREGQNRDLVASTKLAMVATEEVEDPWGLQG
jgi:hypothetical protein